MKTKFLAFLDDVRSSFWFVPALMVAAAILLAWTTVSLDTVIDMSSSAGAGWYYTGGAEGARSLLSTIAASMISVASITFSITIVALTLTSSQFGPRLLRNFMRDVGNQLSLGMFIATFVFCLLALRTIRGDSDNAFVPHVSVTVALAMALASLGILIYFIHHIALAIQANSVVAAVSAELDEAIGRLFPQREKPGKTPAGAHQELAADFESGGAQVLAHNSGYVAAVDDEGLLNLATEKDFVLRVECHAGDFVAQGNSLVTVYPGNRVDDEIFESINGAFLLSAQGSPRQDVEFAIHQLVEVAVRALSPGINDPFTAVACVDRLAAALCQIAERNMPLSEQYDDSGKLRLLLKRITFPGIVDAAFNQIRQYGRSSVAVTIRLMEAIAIVATRAHRAEDRQSLQRHAAMVKRGSQGMPFDECDQRDIDQRYEAALSIFAGHKEPSHRPKHVDQY